MNWTEEQERAIAARGNCIVSAAAGSGKTAVLTERICRLIANDGVRAEELLVLTFTRAAAAEMKSRIRKNLAKAAKAEPDNEKRRRLYAAAAAVGQASISTIDAFCARIVKRHAHLLSLPTSMRILDEADLGEWKDRALRETFLQKDTQEDLSLLLMRIGSTDTVMKLIRRLSEYLDSEPYPDAWLENALGKYDTADSRSRYMAGITERARERLRRFTDDLERERARTSIDAPKALEQLDRELSMCKGLLIQREYGGFREALYSPDLVFTRLSFPRKDIDPEEKALLQNARSALKDAVVKETRPLFLHTSEEELAALEESGRVLRALARMTKAYRAAYARFKLRNNAMDYPDLGHFALRILGDERLPESERLPEGKEIVREYRNRFRYIAVDEYQDTNPLNDRVISLVSGGDNLFYVGDVKQSIYGFRRAEPSLFLEKLAAFPDGGGKRIDLQNNYRSSEAILDSVNEVFRALMRADTNDLVYDGAAELTPGEPGKPGSVELIVIDRTLPDRTDGSSGTDGEEDPSDEDPDTEPDEDRISDDQENVEDLETAVLEARTIAKKIRELIGTRIPNDDKKKGAPSDRALEYGDIAILMRSLPESLAVSAALAENGIPCYAQVTNGYFDATEVLLVLQCLSLIDNAAQDIPLAAVMLSPIGGFLPDELALLRARYPKIPFHQVVRAAAVNGDEKAARFLERLDRWQAKSRRVTVQELISCILTETGLHHVMGAMQSGDIRRGNLEALLAQAAAFESDGARGLSAFLSHIDGVRKRVSIGSAQFSEGNVVRVMSMHKSKGLEFPVVFLPLLGKKFNADDRKATLLLHNDHRRGDCEIGLRYISDGVRISNTAWEGIREKIARQNVSEEMRVLYVAMTRAQYCLILLGTKKGSKKAAGKEILPEGSRIPDAEKVRKAASFLDWISLTPRTCMPLTTIRAEELLSARPEGTEAGGRNAADAAKTEELRRNLAWIYPHEPKPPLPKKTSVSRIRADAMPALASFRDPGTSESSADEAARTGTAVHALLQRLPFGVLTAEEVSAQAEKMVRTGGLAAEAAERILPDRISAFTQSGLWSRAAFRASQGGRMERELPFHVQLDASRFYPDARTEAEPQKIILQGVIDCCFEEDGGWVLLDYKTDRIPEGTAPEKIAGKHRMQLGLYAEALEKLTGLPVREQWIVLLSGPVSVRLA